MTYRHTLTHAFARMFAIGNTCLTESVAETEASNSVCARTGRHFSSTTLVNPASLGSTYVSLPVR